MRRGDESIFFSGPAPDAKSALEAAVRDMGGRIANSTDGYGRSEFVSRWLRFVDDLEWSIVEDERRIDFRSTSRVGYYDFGVNRKRVRELVRRLLAGDDTNFFREHADSR